MSDLINGPWEASGTNTFGLLSEIIAPNADFKEGHLVAVMNNYYFKDGVMKTRLPREMVDARVKSLLALAPEMLAELKKWLEWAKDEGVDGIESTKALIKKAEGK